MTDQENEKVINETELILEDNDIDTAEPLTINIAKVLTYGFDTCPISMKDLKLNERVFNNAKKVHSNFGVFGVPVGYVIHNTSNAPITGIKVPKYTLQDGKYVGVEEEVTLDPDEFLRMPTRYILTLLMKLGNGLKCGNGEFIPMDPDLDTDDYDAKLSNYVFKPMDIFKDYFGGVKCIEPIGYYVIRNRKFEALEILEDFYLERFGNIENLRLVGANNTEEKMQGIELKSNAAKFIGALK